MAAKKGSGDRAAKVAKAGKRSGGYQEPPAPNYDKRAGRDNGLQQFYSPKQLTVQKEIPILVYDKALKGFVNRTRTITVSVDHQFDPTRGHMIFSPVFREKKDR